MLAHLEIYWAILPRWVCTLGYNGRDINFGVFGSG